MGSGGSLAWLLLGGESPACLIVGSGGSLPCLIVGGGKSPACLIVGACLVVCGGRSLGSGRILAWLLVGQW